MTDAPNAEEIDDLADGEPGPDKEPRAAKNWLAMLKEADKVYKTYQDKTDSIDRWYANMEKLSSTTRDREFQIFWANIQVLGPSTYSRPPVPVVVPRFRDRRQLNRIASEVLERVSVVSFDRGRIDDVMRLIRDDLTIRGRGVARVRYEAAKKGQYLDERVCFDFVDRKDFLTTPARIWAEVDWVAFASYLDKKAMRKRFKKTSGNAYKDAAYEERKDDETDEGTLKAKVWEIWHKTLNRVVWVTEGVTVLLDDSKPHLELEGFFPCPKPAYSTIQPRTLIPIADFFFYKDQLEEINELTARLSALTESIKVRGFYPAGHAEVGDAIEAAIKSTTDNQVLVPISNWAAFGGGSAKDTIVWLPIDMIVATVKELVAQRKELIQDVYQITGLSDIMRGSTEASETAAAQQLKSQYGSIRIRDYQSELIRTAKDLTTIAAEIIAENFQAKTILDMSQVEIPSDADLQAEIAPIAAELKKLQGEARTIAKDPEVQAMIRQNPEKAQEVMAQVEQHAGQLEQKIKAIQDKPTIEKVVQLFRDQRVRPYLLDIETDSTIAPDEDAAKKRATEFVTAMGGLIAQATTVLPTMPKAAPLFGETLKFMANHFRAGRELQGKVDEFVDSMMEQSAQPQPPNPAIEADKAKAEREQQDYARQQAERQEDRQATLQDRQSDGERRQAEHTTKMEILAESRQRATEEHSAKLAAINATNQGEAIKNGFPPGYSFDDDRAQFQAIMAEMQAGRTTMTQALERIAEMQAATVAAITNQPKSFAAVRDGGGKLLGIQPVT